MCCGGGCGVDCGRCGGCWCDRRRPVCGCLFAVVATIVDANTATHTILVAVVVDVAVAVAGAVEVVVVVAVDLVVCAVGVFAVVVVGVVTAVVAIAANPATTSIFTI